MAVATAIPTLSDIWDDTKRVHVIGTIAVGASPLTYQTGGLDLDFLASMAGGGSGTVPLPGIASQPTYGRVDGIAGYRYEYKLSTKKLFIRSVAAVTPAGTVAAPTFTGTLGTAPTFTVTKGAIVASTELGLSADATSATVNNNAIASTRILAAANSPVGTTTPAGTNSAPAFTGTAQAAAAMAELAASAIPAAVSGDTITFYVIFKKFR